MSAYLHGTAILGRGTVLGAGTAGIDMGPFAHQLYAISPMSIAQAKRLLQLAITLLKAASDNATDVAATDSAKAKRNDLLSQLNGMTDTINRVTIDPIPEAASDVLKKAVSAAVIEFNSVAEVNAAVAANREQFLADLKNIPAQTSAAIAKKIKEVEKAAETVAKKAAWYTEMTYWIAIGAGVLVVGGVGYGLYRRVSGR